MNKFLMVALAAGMALASTAPAQAREGCGPGMHRGPMGRCRPNGPPVVMRGPSVGVFYPGQGYWDGQRYWAHRGGRRGHWVYN